MFFDRDAAEDTSHVLGMHRLWMRMRAGWPLRKDRLITLKPNVINWIFIDRAIGHCRNGAADEQRAQKCAA